MPKSREPNVVKSRIIVIEEFQPDDHDHEHAGGDDPNGEGVLNQLKGRAGKGGVAELKKRIAAAATKIEPDILPHDIVAVGDHPFSVIGGTLVGHQDAEHKGGRITLSLLRQDVLVWESDRPFVVIVHPVDHEHDHGSPRAEAHDDARPAGGACPSGPSHPFHRLDHPFVALNSSEKQGKLYRVAAGAVRPDALIQRHYKATILIGRRRIDPDLIIVNDN